MLTAQLAGTVEYIDYISAEEKAPSTSVLDMILNNGEAPITGAPMNMEYFFIVIAPRSTPT